VTFCDLENVVPNQEQGKRVQRASPRDRGSGVGGISLLIATTVGLINEWRTLGYEKLWESLALPIWLTIGALPGIGR
jgi:hypothetical protein